MNTKIKTYFGPPLSSNEILTVNHLLQRSVKLNFLSICIGMISKQTVRAWQGACPLAKMQTGCYDANGYSDRKLLLLI